LQNPQAIAEIIEFYRGLHRDREVSEWTAWLGRIDAGLTVSGRASRVDGKSTAE
jgi:hypothetical protein